MFFFWESKPPVNHCPDITCTDSVQPPRKASMAPTVDLQSVPDTQHGVPQGEAVPAEKKFPVYGNNVVVPLCN